MFVGQVAVFLERLLYILTSVCCAGLVWNQTCADFLTWIFSGEDDSSTQHTQPPNCATRKRSTNSHKPKYKRTRRNTSKHEHKCTQIIQIYLDPSKIRFLHGFPCGSQYIIISNVNISGIAEGVY